MTNLMTRNPLARNLVPEEKHWTGFLSEWPNLFAQKSSFGSLDIRKDDDTMKIWVDLPGVSREEIDLTYENDRLLIRASREEESSGEDGYFHTERSWGDIERSLYLPGLDPDFIKASLDEGVLLLEMKPPQEKGKRIKIEQ